jgi:hypothetical protein
MSIAAHSHSPIILTSSSITGQNIDGSLFLSYISVAQNKLAVSTAVLQNKPQIEIHNTSHNLNWPPNPLIVKLDMNVNADPQDA